MVDDKYIGLALAVSGSFAIGTSFIITKKGLNDAASRDPSYTAATDSYTFFKNPIWWAGMSTLAIGEVANFAAYTFAPPILVTSLGTLSVLIGAILASFLLNEELGHLGRLGCTLCLIGPVIIVLHAPEDKPLENVDQFLHYVIQPGFLLYCFTVLVYSLVMIYTVAPRHGRTNPLVYISICSLVGSVSVMAIKGFGVAIKITLAGKNQFTHPSTYVFGIVLALCIVVQMNYFNKALDTFSTNVVNPMYYVGFSTATLVASLILFQGLNTTDATNTISLLAGFVVTFLGVHLLNISRIPEPVDGETPHTALEAGLLNPRLSLQGRVSSEGWNGVVVGGRSGGPLSPASMSHGRRSSIYRAQSATLFNSFGLARETPTENVALEEMREEEEVDDENENDDDDDDDDDGADERTHLRSGKGRERRRDHHGRNPSPRDISLRDTQIEPPI